MKIVTATGKEFESDYLVSDPTGTRIFLRVLGVRKEKAEEVFRDPEETAVLSYGPISYEGFYFESILQEGSAMKVSLVHG